MAIAAAERAFETWKKETPTRRADLLFRTAAILRERKHEFSAVDGARGGEELGRGRRRHGRGDRLLRVLRARERCATPPSSR